MMSTKADTEPQNLTAQGTIVASMTGVSRVTGFARDIVLSHFFGATFIADAFFVSFRIPNFFRRLFAEGAFAQAFIPVLAEYRDGDRARLNNFVRTVAGNLTIVLVLVTILGVAGAKGLVILFAPGFWGDPERMKLATEMVRVMFPYLAFISLTAYAAALLNSFNRFALPAFTPVLLNLVLIAAALVAAPAFETPVMAIAWGVFAAGFVQLLFQIPSLRRLDLLHALRTDWSDRGVRKVGRLLVPAVFAASVNQINGLVGTILASLLVTGSISWLYYADRLMELPVGLVAIALGTVLLPNLSRLHAEDDRAGFAATLDWGFRMALLLGVPASVALFVLAVPLVATVFLHGEMTAPDATMAARALQAFALGLPALVVAKIAAPGFFARQDTRTPFHYATVSVSVNVVASLALFSWLAHIGLALATSIAAVVNGVLLVSGLLRRGDYAPTSALRRIIIVVLVASAVMAAVLEWLVPGETVWLRTDISSRVWMLSAAVLGGGALYVFVAFLMGVRTRDLRHRV